MSGAPLWVYPPVRTLTPLCRVSLRCRFSEDSRHFLSASFDGKVVLSDVLDNEKPVFEFLHKFMVVGAMIHPVERCVL